MKGKTFLRLKKGKRMAFIQIIFQGVTYIVLRHYGLSGIGSLILFGVSVIVYFICHLILKYKGDISVFDIAVPSEFAMVMKLSKEIDKKKFNYVREYKLTGDHLTVSKQISDYILKYDRIPVIPEYIFEHYTFTREGLNIKVKKKEEFVPFDQLIEEEKIIFNELKQINTKA